MRTMQPVNLRSFRQKAKDRKNSMRRFLTKLGREAPRGLDKKIAVLEKEVWQEIDCLTCANCCKTMTPTFTNTDMKRISAHLNMTVDAFQKKWGRNIPDDCAGFPHLSKKFKDYVHIHKQNVELCPATFRLVEKMMVLERGQ